MSLLRKMWHLVRWPLCILLVLYVALVIYRIPAVGEKQKTADTIARIEAQKITLADVMGDILPAPPNQENNDATVAGIDANNNGIRDDVELAIFKLHPGSAKIRAAELQYALTEQMFLDDVFNTETWVAVAQQDSRAYQCVSQSVPNSGNLTNDLKIIDTRLNEITSLVFNDQARKTAETKAYNFTTSYADLTGVSDCDIDLNTLPN